MPWNRPHAVPARTVALTVALVGPLLLPAAATAQTPSAACGGLAVALAPGAPEDGRRTLYATVPPGLGDGRRESLAFSATSDGRPLTVDAARLTSRSVAIVLSADSATSQGDYDQGRIAARELLIGLPEGARTSLISGSGAARVVTGPSPARSPAAYGLGELVRPQGRRSTDQAVRIAAQQLPAGGHVVLVSDSAQDADAATARVAAALARQGVMLERINYGPAIGQDPTGALTGAACAPGEAQGLLAQVDTVLSRLQNSYRLEIAVADSSRPADLLVSVTAPDGASARAAVDPAGRVVPAPSATDALDAPVREDNLQPADRWPPTTTLLLAAWGLTLLAALVATGAVLRRRPPATGWVPQTPRPHRVIDLTDGQVADSVSQASRGSGAEQATRAGRAD